MGVLRYGAVAASCTRGSGSVHGSVFASVSFTRLHRSGPYATLWGTHAHLLHGRFLLLWFPGFLCCVRALSFWFVEAASPGCR